MVNPRLLALAVALLVVAGGCLSSNLRAVGGPTNERLGMRSVAIALLVNRCKSPEAAAVVRDMVIERLAATTTLRVVDVPTELGLDPERLDRTRAQEIAVKLEVDGMLVGTVFAFDYTEGGDNPAGLATPVVQVDLRLVAAATGNIVWAASAHAEKSLLFTYDSVPRSEAARTVVAQLTDDLAGRL